MIMNDNLRMMDMRLGNIKIPTKQPNTVEGVDDLARRINTMGGIPQQDRMIRDKYRTLLRALKASYQGAWIKKYYPDYIETMDRGCEQPLVRALINPNKLKMDYDDKILSVPFDAGFKIGDIFEWVNTGTYWLVELQDLEELAYFRGEIRKCTYEIAWTDEGQQYSTYAAIRGPVEAKINYIQKHGISIDTPNHSLYIRMPLNEHTLKQFQRYSKFYLQDIGTEDKKVCWRVEATDSISVPGLLEITAVEYYANETEDDIENGVVGGLIVQPINPNPDLVEQTIKGETFIKPKKVYEYQFIGTQRGEWAVDKKGISLEGDGKTVKVRWLSNYSGQFNLTYGDYTKTIVVESLF